MKTYQAIASTFTALASLDDTASRFNWTPEHLAQVRDTWELRLKTILSSSPSGSGIDCGTKFWDDRSTSSRLVFFCEFHHMNHDGYYDGWTQHKITVRPSFSGIDLTISGPNRNEIKDYLHDVYHSWLTEEESI